MRVSEIIGKVRSEGRNILMEDEAKEILAAQGIPVTPCRVARSEAQAVSSASELGYPVVLKVRSPKIVHKSDSGGVCLNLTDEASVRAAYREIIEKAAPLDPVAAVTVQPVAKKGTEVLIGVTSDGQFGPVVAFGLGGVFAEILKDVSFRLAPIDREEAGKMIRQVKGSRLLEGYRGTPAADTGALAEIITKVSRLAVEHEEIAAMDLNPVAACPDGALVLDARVILKEKGVCRDAQ
ncbi:MAG: acetate--CoA ligase family protein [Peptococcaceae bacterium]|nr:acetate--CoA ligase family protein [Peptococcaceae bacterium]